MFPAPTPPKHNPGLGKSKLEWTDTTGVNWGGMAHAQSSSSPPATTVQSWPFSFLIGKNAENYNPSILHLFYPYVFNYFTLKRIKNYV